MHFAVTARQLLHNDNDLCIVWQIVLDQKEALAQMLSHGVDANHWDYEKRYSPVFESC